MSATSCNICATLDGKVTVPAAACDSARDLQKIQPTPLKEMLHECIESLGLLSHPSLVS